MQEASRAEDSSQSQLPRIALERNQVQLTRAPLECTDEGSWIFSGGEKKGNGKHQWPENTPECRRRLVRSTAISHSCREGP